MVVAVIGCGNLRITAPANRVNFHAALELLGLAKDRAWLAKVTNALNQHWQRKITAKKCGVGLASRGREALQPFLAPLRTL